MLAKELDKPFSNAFVKNRYVFRTFILPGQKAREKSVRRKLSPIASEFKGKVVALIDDSIVRGTTSREIVCEPPKNGWDITTLLTPFTRFKWPGMRARARFYSVPAVRQSHIRML